MAVVATLSSIRPSQNELSCDGRLTETVALPITEPDPRGGEDADVRAGDACAEVAWRARVLGGGTRDADVEEAGGVGGDEDK